MQQPAQLIHLLRQRLGHLILLAVKLGLVDRALAVHFVAHGRKNVETDMRALILSDIHANLRALEAVLADAPQHDVVWNLGDIVGYGANPNEVVELARKLNGIVVRGNHDRACSGTMHFSEYRDLSWVASCAAQWTQGVLTSTNSEWLSRLRRGPLRPLGRKVTCVHGSPRNEDVYILSREDAGAALRKSRARIILFGHTHRQGGWCSNRGKIIPLKPDFGSGAGAVQCELPIHRQSLCTEPQDPLANLVMGTGVRRSPCSMRLSRCLSFTACRTECSPRRQELGEPNFPSSWRHSASSGTEAA